MSELKNPMGPWLGSKNNSYVADWKQSLSQLPLFGVSPLIIWTRGIGITSHGKLFEEWSTDYILNAEADVMRRS
jgi:hypothetical protein